VSIASRNTSPSMLNPRTNRLIASPGSTISRGAVKEEWPCVVQHGTLFGCRGLGAEPEEVEPGDGPTRQPVARRWCGVWR
jgi:hypothetical protein